MTHRRCRPLQSGYFATWWIRGCVCLDSSQNGLNNSPTLHTHSKTCVHDLRLDVRSDRSLRSRPCWWMPSFAWKWPYAPFSVCLVNGGHCVLRVVKPKPKGFISLGSMKVLTVFTAAHYTFIFLGWTLGLVMVLKEISLLQKTLGLTDATFRAIWSTGFEILSVGSNTFTLWGVMNIAASGGYEQILAMLADWL